MSWRAVEMDLRVTRVLETLKARGVMIVATSDYPPDGLLPALPAAPVTLTINRLEACDREARQRFANVVDVLVDHASRPSTSPAPPAGWS